MWEGGVAAKGGAGEAWRVEVGEVGGVLQPTPLLRMGLAGVEGLVRVVGVVVVVSVMVLGRVQATTLPLPLASLPHPPCSPF